MAGPLRACGALLLLTATLTAQSGPTLIVSAGHPGGPSRAAFVAGHLATASWSNLTLVELASGLIVSHLPHPGLITAMEASRDGQVLAVGTCDRGIYLWNVASRTLSRRIALAQECPDSLSFSPDGALIAVDAYGCCAGAGLQVWDVRTGTQVQSLGSGLRIRTVAFSGDGRWLAGVDDKAIGRIYEWPSGRVLQTLSGLKGAGASHSRAVSSPDGKYLAWLGEQGLQVWDVAAGTQIPLPGARSVRIQDSPPDGPPREWTEQQVSASAVQFLDDGRLLYVGGDADQAMVATLPGAHIEVVPLAPPRTEWIGHLGLMTAPRWHAIRRDGLMLGGEFAGRTVLWEVAAGRLRELTAPPLTGADSLRWGRSGIVAWGGGASGLHAWDDARGQPAALRRRDDWVEGLAFRPDGQRLAVLGSSAVTILDVFTRRQVATMDLPDLPSTGVAFSADGALLALQSAGALTILDGRLRTQRRLETLAKHMAVEHVAFSPDGRWIAAGLGGPEPAVRVWPASGGAAVTLDTGRLTYGPQPPAFSADSRWLATFSKGETVAVWATRSWTIERTWGLPVTGRALAFAPQGSQLAIVGHGESAVWDAASGQKLRTLIAAGSNHGRDVAWSPDGRRLATSADDGVLRFWDASTGSLIASLYSVEGGGGWLLVAADGRIDGSAGALRDLVAWRVGDRVARDATRTNTQRVRGLWRLLTSRPPPPR